MGESAKEADLKQTRQESKNASVKERNYATSFLTSPDTGGLTVEQRYTLKKEELKIREAEVEVQKERNDLERMRMEMDATRICLDQCSRIPEVAAKIVDKEDEQFNAAASEVGRSLGLALGRAYNGEIGGYCGETLGDCAAHCMKAYAMYTREERINELVEKERNIIKRDLKKFEENAEK